jgi:type II secretory pathway pseudopilin PulG
VEIAMVASVIAIIALLILPIFRKRAEDAREVAAQDEVQSLVKALLLVEADMPGGGYLPPLNDLDNRESQGTTLNDTPDLQPSRLKWGELTPGNFGFGILSDAEWSATSVPNWRGPYIAVRKSVTLAELRVRHPETTSSNGQGSGQGPIFIPPLGAVAANSPNPWTATSIAADRYPIDPWGRPYLLFGSETDFNVRAVYSMGANGVPGPPTSNPTRPTIASDYDRVNGILGDGDDIEFIF